MRDSTLSRLRLHLSLARLPALTAGALFGLAGSAFILATLIMARVLDERTFSQVVLLIAICNISIAVAPAGLNGITLRHDLRSDRKLLMLGAVAVMVTAVAATALALFVYGFDPFASAVVLGTIHAGGIALLARAAFQRAQRFQTMVALDQSANCILLIAAVLMVLGIGRTPWFPTLLVGCWYLLLGVLAWRWVLTHQTGGRPFRLHMWRDAANFGGLALAGELLVQLERLLVPLTLGSSALAQYAVAAAVALAPYRMLELGTTSTLTARLRRAASVERQRSILKREAGVSLGLAAIGGVAIAVIGPQVVRIVTPDDMIVSGLILAVVISGFIRVCSALAQSAAAALCAGTELRWINLSSWTAIAIGAGVGSALAPLGLAWLVYGVATGWVWRTLIAAGYAGRHLRAARLREEMDAG